MKKFCLLLVVLVMGCRASVALPIERIELVAPQIDARKTPFQRVVVEVAATDESRERGLMFRQELAEGKGMLFVWDEADVRKFWMKNTYIPLDILFFNDGVLVDIVAGAKPHDETPVGPDVLVDAVLEVPAGYAAKRRIQVGWELRRKFY